MFGLIRKKSTICKTENFCETPYDNVWSRNVFKKEDESIRVGIFQIIKHQIIILD